MILLLYSQHVAELLASSYLCEFAFAGGFEIAVALSKVAVPGLVGGFGVGVFGSRREFGAVGVVGVVSVAFEVLRLLRFVVAARNWAGDEVCWVTVEGGRGTFVDLLSVIFEVADW